MKFYITTAIDYINGKPHIGHLYEKVASDVLARFNRLKGNDVFFLTGTDEHGAKIAAYASQQGMDAQEFADKTAKLFQDCYDNMEISYSRFIRTTDKDHLETVAEILKKIHANSFTYEGEYSGLYCVGHEAFMTEKELVNGWCPEHNIRPEPITEKNWFLKMSEFTDVIAKKIERREFVIWPEQRRNEVLSLLKQGFNDIAITRPNVKWGIPAPWDSSQTVYVWIDALINYVTGVGFKNDPSEFGKYWPADWHVIGKDILKFHCIVWPAVLLAAGLEMPKGVVVHGYLTVGGQKISKTIGNVIDPGEWIAKFGGRGAGSDAVRYLLMREIAFGQDGDVSEQKLRARYEGDLANGLGNLVSRLTNMIEKFSGGKIPEIVAAPRDLAEVGELIDQFRFHDALAKIWESVAWANQYIDENRPWELALRDAAKLNHVLSELAAQVNAIAKMLSPFMPHSAERIRKALEGERIIKINDLFPRIL